MNLNQFLDRQFPFVPFLIGCISSSAICECPFVLRICTITVSGNDMHLLLIHSVLLLHALVQLQSTSKTGRILGEKSARRQYRKTQGKCQME